MHAADLHLGCTFQGLSEVDEDLSKSLWASTFQVFSDIVDLAIAEKACFLLVSGDVYEGPGRNFQAQRRLKEGLERLGEAGIRSFIVHGNHDPTENRFTELDWPESCHFFGHKSVEVVAVESDGEPLAQVYGVSYRRRDVKTDLARAFRRTEDAGIHIGVLHCSVSGASEGHEPYAPCSIDDLVASGMDYWALGHVHAPRILKEKDPLVVYPGCPQGRQINESGPHGVFVVDVDSSGNLHPREVPVDRYRWERIEVETSGCRTLEEVLSVVATACERASADDADKGHIFRINLVGKGPVHTELANQDDFAGLVDEIRGSVGLGVAIESVTDHTGPDRDIDALAAEDTLVGYFVRQSKEIIEDGEAMEELERYLSELYAKPNVKKLLGGPDKNMLREYTERALVRGVDMLLEDEGK